MNTKFYAAFGSLACSFSNMESAIRNLISEIAFQGNDQIAYAFMDRVQLSESIKLLQKLSRVLPSGEDEFILEMKNRVEKIRPTRNLFIHGQWIPGDFGTKTGKATVLDSKMTYTDTDNLTRWGKGSVSEYTLEDFNRLISEVESIQGIIEHIESELKSACDLENVPESSPLQ